MWNDFKKFAMKGNVVDLAIAVILGAAFGKIVTSIVNDLIMPIIGLILGGIDFKGLSVSVGDAVIAYGLLIQSIVDFLIIAVVLFVVVKVYTRLKKKEEKEEKKAEPVVVNKQEELLAEIRDLLKARS